MFWVAEGKQSEFEEVFGPSGTWPTLLGRSEGYMATVLTCESQLERRYRILDFWVSHYAFEVFRDRFAARCERFNQLVSAEGLIKRQWLVGTYYTVDPSGTEGDDLVLESGTSPEGAALELAQGGSPGWR